MNCCDPPTGIVAEPGATLIDTRVNPSSVALPTTPPFVAEIVVVPGPITWASPDGPMFATPVFDDVQATDVVITRVVPSL